MPRKPSHTLTLTLDLSALTEAQRASLWSELSTAATEREGLSLDTAGGRHGVDVLAVGAILARRPRTGTGADLDLDLTRESRDLDLGRPVTHA